MPPKDERGEPNPTSCQSNEEKSQDKANPSSEMACMEDRAVEELRNKWEKITGSKFTIIVSCKAFQKLNLSQHSTFHRPIGC